MDLSYFKSKNRLELYKKHNHVPNIEIKKYTFDQIDFDFDKLEKKNIFRSVFVIFTIRLKFQIV